MLAELRAAFVPNRILAVVSEGKDLSAQAKIIEVDELERRVVRYRANPGSLLTLEELQARVEKRK